MESDPLPKDNIFGIDIYPHYARSENPFNAIYALTILEGSTIKQFTKIPKSRILHLITSQRPTILAIDNIYELAPNLSSIRHLFSILPSETRVIQITGSPNESKTLQEVAANYGLKPPSKISPLEESEACAKLAALGAGSDIQVMENETKISICRSVSLGPGGTSQSRYRRNIHSTILTITKNIEETLNDAGIDYDLFTEGSDFGFERAVFHVYTPKMKLIGIVKPSQGNYVRVKVTPVYRNQVEFIPREKPKSITSKKDFNNKNKKLILGVDPGTTCGLAAITLNSYPVYIGSHRGISRGDIARIVLELGEIIIIAADVTPAPEFVLKLAKMVSAEIYRPETLLEASEKQSIAQIYEEKYNVKIKDPHERDALVAAIKAYQHYKNKFEQLEAEIQKTGSSLPIDEAKTLIVKGFSIQKAIDLLIPKKIDKVESMLKTEEERSSLKNENLFDNYKKKLFFYKDQAKRYKDLNEGLKNNVKTLELKVKNLQNSLETILREEGKKIRKERELEILHRELETLRRQINELKEEGHKYQKRIEMIHYYKELELRGEVVFIKPIELFTKSGLEKSIKNHDIKRDDVIILLDTNDGDDFIIDELIKRKIKAVIACTLISQSAEDKFRDYNIPVIPSKNLKIEDIEGYRYIKTDDLERAIDELVKREKLDSDKILEEIAKEYKKERKKQMEEQI